MPARARTPALSTDDTNGDEWVQEQLRAYRQACQEYRVASLILAQIHPHFLFNALISLYGVIPREAKGARQTVLNLADILRYLATCAGRAVSG